LSANAALYNIEFLQNGYQELKELLPSSLSAMGCKTTNASILFRGELVAAAARQEISA
jgi:hypothetical protein